MLPGDDTVRVLREALRVSPNNLPLRMHLAQLLQQQGHLEESEKEYREALSLSPQNTELKLGLANVYLLQSKNSQALVIVEDICKRADAPAKAHVLFARLLLRAGDVANAVSQYKLAIENDPSVEDPELSDHLGIGKFEESSEVSDGRVRASWQSSNGPFEKELERPKINFQDVGGMEALKEEISLKIVYPLLHPEMYRAYGKSIGGGILMYGPPGCGKTHLARATAGEIKAGFMAIGINDVLDMWIGNSERNLHEIFAQARKNTPCVIFFDEVDALGGRRSDMQAGTGRHLINQFLSEMDGVEHSNDGVLILAATNAPWHVDPAFRRPGRFDRVLFVPPPDEPARASILRLHCRNKPTENIDYDSIAKKTDQFSGADLQAVIDQSVEGKLRDAMKTGIPKPLTSNDLLAAAKKMKPTTREWFSTARNYAVYSNQGGVYDDVLKYLKL